MGFIEFLKSVLLIALVVGLIEPSLVLRWNNKPSRLKVFVYWLFAFLILKVPETLINNETRNDSVQVERTNIDIAKRYIEQENYSDAISKLEDIQEESSFFNEAQILLHQADSLNKMTPQEREFARELAAKKAAEEKLLKQRRLLEREINSIKEGIDFEEYSGDLGLLQIEIALFGTWANMIREGQKSNDQEINKLATQLRSKVESIQNREFPRLRKEYTKSITLKLWENDIYVTASGTGNRNISFVGGVFAANKNIKDFHLELYDIFEIFRFKKVEYKWYRGADVYPSFEMYKGKDSVLVISGN